MGTLWVAGILGVFMTRGHALYLPMPEPQRFQAGQSIQGKVHRLISPKNEVPMEYYSMPFCFPAQGIKLNLSSNHLEAPQGPIKNQSFFRSASDVFRSPYNFTILGDQRTQVVCGSETSYGPLNMSVFERLKTSIQKEYKVHLTLDGLPITTFDLEAWPGPGPVPIGFQVGYQKDGKLYINNHLMFKVLVHEVNTEPGNSTESTASPLKQEETMAESDAASIVEEGVAQIAPETVRYMIVGFEVLACSISRDPSKKPKDISCIDENWTGTPLQPQEIVNGMKIVYTYDTFWELSNISPASRMSFFQKRKIRSREKDSD